MRIGAATKLAEMADSDLLKKRYPMLVEAINMISSPELRNASTLGGDLLQEVWCQYLRGGYSCWRNGGHMCYGAIGDNSYYHSAMGGRLCYAVYPGDAAVALIPFDARVKLATPGGTKELTLEQLVPGDMMVDGRIQSHVVRFNEILTEVVLPAPKPEVRASFEKLRPRGVWDFAMASLALSLQVRDNTIEDARVVFGGIAGKPLRERAVEDFLKGKNAERGLRRTGGLRLLWRTPRRSNTTRPRSTWRKGCWLREWRSCMETIKGSFVRAGRLPGGISAGAIPSNRGEIVQQAWKAEPIGQPVLLAFAQFRRPTPLRRSNCKPWTARRSTTTFCRR